LAACRILVLPPGTEPDIVKLALDCDLGASLTQVRELTLEYLDTFDGRVYRAAARLVVEQERRTRHLLINTATERYPISRAPVWAHELPVQQADLRRKIGVRALGPTLVRQLVQSEYGILDDLDKTVVRLEVKVGAVTSGTDTLSPAPTEIRIFALRGFDEFNQRFIDAVLSSWPQAQEVSDELEVLASACGFAVAGHSTKLALELDPSMPVNAALKVMLRTMHAQIDTNVAGTKVGIDSEFLHDLRVAVRRSRAWLSCLRGQIEPHLRTRAVGELKWLSEQTGTLRDLDVYLLKLDVYAGALPAPDAGALEPLREHLRLARGRAQRALRADLNSPRFAEFMHWWQAVLAQSDTESIGQAVAPAPDEFEETALAVANRVIWKRLKKVLKQGRAISAHTPAQELHKLRLECKQLRYLFEAFSSLYPAKKIRRLVRALRRLQNHLGEFQDLEVQQDGMRLFAHKMFQRRAPEIPTLLAMGRLIEQLHQRQMAQRESFAGPWADFDNPRNTRFSTRAFRRPNEAEDFYEKWPGMKPWPSS
jgi:CHAD domain-containing protein